MTLDQYILDHTTAPDDYLCRLYRATNLHLLRPRMASGHLQGQLLRMLMQMQRPHTVVEIGTYSGYSALAMASGMERGSRVITFEINDEQEAFRGLRALLTKLVWRCTWAMYLASSRR